ncbi:MAG: pectinesterase family protein [Bacteroidales bacterium]|nr:pectinesterase family protein [Bacteroidales bacterium]
MKRIFLSLSLFLSVFVLYAQTPAFPTAEGYGMWATGGRGGQVVEVTTLEDNAANPIAGSLRWAMKQHSGQPITIVFRVSGIIDLKGNDLRMNRSNVTIAGQTAPGDGICIKGGCVNMGGSRNLIIRHLRSRVGTLNDTVYNPDVAPTSVDFIPGASLNIENGGNFIVDHCSFAWSAEENVGFYDNDNTTVQWCIFAEGLYDAGHGKGARSYGAVLGGKTATYHHNLLAHNYNRSPRFGATTKNDVVMLLDFVNNVNYNFGKKNACYGGDNRQGSSGLFQLNFVNNYYKHGPAYPGDRTAVFIGASYSNETGKSYGKWHLSGNYINGSANSALNTDNYKGLDISAYTEAVPSITMAMMKSDHIPVLYPVNTESAQEAYNSVLEGAGAFPRDTMDRRIIHEVTTGTATAHSTFNNHRVCGIVNKPSDSGGYPVYNTYNQVKDEDHDGMDDDWELAKGLDPSNANDRNLILKSGYTALDAYLCSLVGEDIPVETSKPYDIVVAKDGSGDFTSINAAIETVPENTARKTIFIKKGVYEEKVFIGNRWQGSKKVISLIGENVDSVVIVWEDYHGKTISYPGKEGTISADGMTAATFTVTAPDFYMENITIKNPSKAAQAEAIYQSGDRQVLKNCKILGNQDTHRTKKGNRYFYYQCTIEGGVDFIYAGGTCYFYQCKIVSNRNGYITAPEDITYTAKLSNGKTLYYGFIFNDCDLLAKDGANDVYLGRPWAAESGSIFMNCRLGSHINQTGWNAWGGNEQNCSFAEYKSLNADGSALADVSKRVSWSMQLSDKDRYNLLGMNTIYRAVSSGTFDPISQFLPLSGPRSLVVNNRKLGWTAVENAVGYIVYANNAVIDFAETNSYYDVAERSGTVNYKVKAIAENGRLSTFNGSSGGVTSIELDSLLNPKHWVYLSCSVTPDSAGVILQEPSAKQHLAGAKITLTAQRRYGYKFIHWINADNTVLSTEESFVLTLDKDEQVTAVFEKLPLYSLNCTVIGGLQELINISGSDTIIDGISFYEAGTEVSLRVVDHELFRFDYWEDSSTDSVRTITMDENKNLTARFRLNPFIVAWTFKMPGNSFYTSDYYSDENNIGELNLRNQQGNTAEWQKYSHTTGGYLGRPAVVNGNALNDRYYYEASFSTKGYSDIVLKSAMAVDSNGYSIQNAEYSTDNAVSFETLGIISIDSTKSWKNSVLPLPENAWDQELIYVRWIPDYSSELFGDSLGTDGTAITDIYVLLQEKDALPKLSGRIPLKVWTDGNKLVYLQSGQPVRVVNVFDMTGRCVVRLSGEEIRSVNLSALSKGMYVLAAYNDLNENSIAKIFLK